MFRFRFASLVLLLMVALPVGCAAASSTASAASWPPTSTWKSVPNAGHGPWLDQMRGAWPIARIGPSLSPRPEWMPVLKVVSGFGSAVIQNKPEAARRYLSPDLQSNKETVDRMLGLPARPYRFAFQVGHCDMKCGTVTMTFFFPDGRSPVLARLDLSKLAAGWRIATITHLAG